MVKRLVTAGLTGMLTIAAVGVFVVFGGVMGPSVRANEPGGGGCTPNECQQNGCPADKGPQSCNIDGKSWLACGTC